MYSNIYMLHISIPPECIATSACCIYQCHQNVLQHLHVAYINVTRMYCNICMLHISMSPECVATTACCIYQCHQNICNNCMLHISMSPECIATTACCVYQCHQNVLQQLHVAYISVTRMYCNSCMLHLSMSPECMQQLHVAYINHCTSNECNKPQKLFTNTILETLRNYQYF